MTTISAGKKPKGSFCDVSTWERKLAFPSLVLLQHNGCPRAFVIQMATCSAFCSCCQYLQTGRTRCAYPYGLLEVTFCHQDSLFGTTHTCTKYLQGRWLYSQVNPAQLWCDMMFQTLCANPAPQAVRDSRCIIKSFLQSAKAVQYSAQDWSSLALSDFISCVSISDKFFSCHPQFCNHNPFVQYEINLSTALSWTFLMAFLLKSCFSFTQWAFIDTFFYLKHFVIHCT